jgi:electron transfer flavoprotein alpha subunit
MSAGREVWVWAEQRQKKLAGVSLELLGKGRELADRLGADLASVLVGKGIIELGPELVSYGADKVYLLQDKRLEFCNTNLFARIIADLATRFKPQVLLVGGSTLGREISASVAARLNTGLTAHCIDLYIDEESRLVQVVPWEENRLMEIVCLRSPQMATARPGIFPKPVRNDTRKGEIIEVAFPFSGEDSGFRVVEIVEEQRPEATLEAAEVVVAGGWGLHPVGGFAAIRELAQILGAAVGGTRPAVDAGWISEEQMIGQSGKIVSPRLFISIGASGAMHFVTGFLGSKVILAVDQNPEAPIFEVADIGLVGDLRELLPLLTNEIRRLRRQSQQ